jgi:hypothetical protein
MSAAEIYELAAKVAESDMADSLKAELYAAFDRMLQAA